MNDALKGRYDHYSFYEKAVEEDNIANCLNVITENVDTGDVINDVLLPTASGDN